MLLDFSELSIEEATCCLKAVDNREQLPFRPVHPQQNGVVERRN
jgi:hypothetical protein